ncbi:MULTISPECIES: hypothetical protein [Ramlibacter]|uniref:Uncharacterized protein n=1 Tax=Ramlibacter pinisoli TaxID=2682844 RepID=A0A6N8J387_9BURK|nr:MULTISPECIES: hypothetical protein [Ramlibacter]MBA2962781.1 hypothetical protein [Ramlibacter sp. CGMCC 1.13660]MVQ32723.1 hypothetical protein [Ramlibacter pinisoli]
MRSRQRALVAALAWTGIVAAGLGACGGSGEGGGSAAVPGSGGTGNTASTLNGASASTTLGTASPTTGATTGTTTPTVLGDCTMFPPEAVFNTRIDDPAAFPVHASSAGWVAAVGSGTAFHADWWLGEDPSQPTAYYGIPWNVVDGSAATTAWPSVQYDFTPTGRSTEVGWPHESDCAVADGSGYNLQRGCGTVPVAQRRFPFPLSGVKNEGGTCNDPATCGDHHVLVVEQGACRLWEAYHAYASRGQWYALSTAAWDLKSLALRPSGWTAADAAGLPITPFLAKAAEASSGEIRHALRVTLRDSVIANSFVWPARHAAGSTAGSIPFGALLRLKSDFVIPDTWTTQAKAIATAAKQYGLYVADIGVDFYVQGEPSAAWDENTFRQLGAISMAQMEFVDLRSVTGNARFSSDSLAARWN